LTWRAAFVADVHLANHRRFGGVTRAGRNERCRQIESVLLSAVDLAVGRGVDNLVVLGDLFDTSKPSVGELYGAMSVLAAAPHPLLLLGNHDLTSDADTDNALAPFHWHPTDAVLDRPAVTANYAAIPFRVGAASDWLPRALEAEAAAIRELRPRTLLLHLGISDEETPDFMRASADSVSAQQLFDLMRHYGFEYAYAGNWHTPKQWHDGARFITQCGALVPTGFDNPGLNYGKVVLHTDGRAPEVVSIPGPRFLRSVFEDFDQTELPDLSAGGERIYLSFIAQPDRLAAARAKLAELIAAGVVVDGEVKADRVAANAAARGAARLARSAPSIDAAVDSYVARFALPDGASRGEVLALVRRYLASS
jgi:DNA repair exonuclease SbcCD nuclease subunit